MVINNREVVSTHGIASRTRSHVMDQSKYVTSRCHGNDYDPSPFRPSHHSLVTLPVSPSAPPTIIRGRIPQSYVSQSQLPVVRGVPPSSPVQPTVVIRA